MVLVKILQGTGKFILSGVLVFVLSWGLVGCGDRIESQIEQPKTGTELERLAEAAPPEAIVQLDRSLVRYQPQVKIISPKTAETIEGTNVSVKVEVEDLPVYRDGDLGLGPHLAVILDNEPTQEIYDLQEPLVLENVTPGTHTLRVFAVKPWGESFKNEGSYAQTEFSLFASTPQNRLKSSEPILTYNSPQGDYGAEPILLDFYIANAPLHLVARERNNDDIADWRIRVTVNGTSFLLDRWNPIYLKGFDPGINWVKLEFLDEYSNPIENTFNTSVHLFNYQPDGQDTLSQLIRGELPALDASGIVDPNYKPIPTIEEEPTEEIEDTLSTDEEVILDSEPIELEENESELNELEPNELEENELELNEVEPNELEEDILPIDEIAPSELEEPIIEEEVPATEETTEKVVSPLDLGESMIEEEETLEEDITDLEMIEDSVSEDNNRDETGVFVPETGSFEQETIEQTQTTSEIEMELDNTDEIESQATEEEAIAEPENSEVLESDRSFFQGLRDRFMGKTQSDSPTMEDISPLESNLVEEVEAVEEDSLPNEIETGEPEKLLDR